MKFPTASPIVIAALLASVLPLLSACSSTPRPFYAQDSFGGNSPYLKHVPDDTGLACSAAKRTLLGDGYTIEGSSAKGSFKGRKAYRINGDRSTFLEMSVVCLPDQEGSTVFANGLITTYDLKKAPTSASIGFSVIGSVSLPIGQSVDSMVKVSDETITDRAFYQRFFASVEGRLDRIRTESLAVTPKVEKILPAVAASGMSSNDHHAPIAPKTELTDLDPRPEPVPVATSNANSDSPVTSPTSPASPTSNSTNAVLASTTPKALDATSSSSTTGSATNTVQIVPSTAPAAATSATPPSNASVSPMTPVNLGNPITSSSSPASNSMNAAASSVTPTTGSVSTSSTTTGGSSTNVVQTAPSATADTLTPDPISSKSP
jgi:hypothetical protein